MITLSRDRLIVLLGGSLALATVIGGFVLGGTPAHFRMLKNDEARLQRIASDVLVVQTIYNQGQPLPDSNEAFQALPRQYSGKSTSPAIDPVYRNITSSTYELCATFEQASDPKMYDGRPTPSFTTPQYYFDSWRTHPAGRVCYSFTVIPPDPEGSPGSVRLPNAKPLFTE